MKYYSSGSYFMKFTKFQDFMIGKKLQGSKGHTTNIQKSRKEIIIRNPQSRDVKEL